MGGNVEPLLASRIMIYTYSRTFHINPMEAYNTPANLLLEMMQIHGETKKIEQDEIEKAVKKSGR